MPFIRISKKEKLMDLGHWLYPHQMKQNIIPTILGDKSFGIGDEVINAPYEMYQNFINRI